METVVKMFEQNMVGMPDEFFIERVDDQLLQVVALLVFESERIQDVYL